MKTSNVIIVCVTAIICTGLLAFAIKRHHGCGKHWGGHFRHEDGMGEKREGRHGGEYGDGRAEFRDHFRGNMDPQEMAERQTERMKMGLSLTEEQVGKVEAINLKYAEKRKGIMEGIKSQMESIGDEKEKELSTILNKDQLAKYDEFRKEMKEHWHNAENEK